ncbi:unnamed protein product [Victoria cruziana]
MKKLLNCGLKLLLRQVTYLSLRNLKQQEYEKVHQEVLLFKDVHAGTLQATAENRYIKRFCCSKTFMLEFFKPLLRTLGS